MVQRKRGSDHAPSSEASRAWREAAAMAGSMGLGFAISVGLGGGLGFLLDGWCGWRPIVWTPLLSLVGAGAGFWMAARFLGRTGRRRSAGAEARRDPESTEEESGA